MSAKKRPSTFEILNLLEKSNCRECGLPTCMAFAALVYQGQRKIEECPRLDVAELGDLGELLLSGEQAPWVGGDLLDEFLERFGKGIDLEPRAEPLGGWYSGERLVFHCLGKIFEMDQRGGLHSQCHQNPWLHVPMLSYVLDSDGLEPKGNWVRFEELKGVSSWVNFFDHACVKPLREMAAADPVLLQDVLHLFADQEDLEGFEADSSFLLLPLPRIPFLYTYQAADEEFPESFSVFLDRTAERNLDPESLYRLGSGMSNMFRKIAQRHGGV